MKISDTSLRDYFRTIIQNYHLEREAFLRLEKSPMANHSVDDSASCILRVSEESRNIAAKTLETTHLPLSANGDAFIES